MICRAVEIERMPECRAQKVLWSESFAVGDKRFVERIKGELGFRACGRQVHEGLEADMCVLREPTCPYGSDSDMENGHLSVGNGSFWEIFPE